MESIVNLRGESKPKAYKVANPFGHLVLVVDPEGGRWVPLAHLSEAISVPMGSMLAKIDKSSRYWGYQNLDVPCVAWRLCLPTTKITSLLQTIKERQVPSNKWQVFRWLQSNAYKSLNGFHIPEPVAPMLVEEPEPIVPLVPKVEAPIVTSSELIPIQQAQFGDAKANAVSGRDLHGFLEVGKDFTTWMKDHIEAFGFVEHQDFEISDVLRSPESGSTKARPQVAKEYMISISMAKELAMVQRTPKGKQARLYFIECERRALAAVNPVQQFRVPTNLREALHLAAELEDKRMELACKVEEQQATIADLVPKAEFTDRVTNTKDLISIREFAKVLGDTGQNRFYQWLRSKGYVMPNGTEPYQKWVDMGVFVVIERAFEDTHGLDRVSRKTMITGKGQVRFQREWDADHGRKAVS